MQFPGLGMRSGGNLLFRRFFENLEPALSNADSRFFATVGPRYFSVISLSPDPACSHRTPPDSCI